MPDLKRYREKRDLGSTPEPAGAERAARSLGPAATRAFVVQQHAARAMHWDLRLEIDGVLVSFAVPKGPTFDPAERRLAVRTEDHPLEYADFEGIIPAGNYGAGHMIVWDRGGYRSADGVAPSDGLAAGKLDLVLEGHKLRGRFALVRMKSQDERNWLLLAKGPSPTSGKAAPDRGELVEQEPASVLSGLRVEELGAAAARDAEVCGLPAVLRSPEHTLAASELRPMLASRGERPFSADGWLFELKYDGVRALLEKRADGSLRIHARSGADRTRTYPELARALPHLPVSSCVLDGEIVALDAAGRSSFERMQRRFTQTDPAAIERAELEVPVVYYAFDLLAVCGRDLRREPLRARKEVLARFCPRLGYVRFADHVEGDGEALFEVAQQHRLEGVVGKRADSRYASGQRAKSWLKLRVPAHANLVIVGIVPGKGSRAELGSLMVAWRAASGLVYAGNVGSGIGAAVERELLAFAAQAQLAKAPCAGVPEPAVRGTRYLRPERVCEVGYSEVTESGVLRQPVFLGLRADVRPEDCLAPADLEALSERAPAPGAPARSGRVEVTRPEKVFWPVEGYTKGDLLAYYEAAWPFLEPYLRDRPVVLTRYPDGIEGKFFYQKNAPDFTPDWVQREQIDDTDYFICNDLRSLLYVINSGAIPLHVWHSRRTDLEHPDWLILDLDPKEAPFEHVVRVARHLHALLEELGAAHFVKTSGQAGLHVLLPLGGQLDHEQARALGEVLARVVCTELPEISTIARPLAARASRVYVDFLQNGRGKLIASAFSVRPRPRAPVSMPLRWSQVTSRLDPGRYNIKSALARIAADGDPLRGVLGQAIDVAEVLGALGERLAAARAGGSES